MSKPLASTSLSFTCPLAARDTLPSPGHTLTVKNRQRSPVNGWLTARWALAGCLTWALAFGAAAFVPGTAFADDGATPQPPPRGAPQAAGKRQATEPKEVTPEERALRGVVSVERGGQSIALGSVLAGDGRILTALSPLGPGNDLEVRFADGTSVRVKLGHHDRVWDLALLIPQSGKWQDGLVAATKSPLRQEASIRSFTASKGKVASAPLTLRAQRALIGGDDVTLQSAIEIGSRVSPADLGSPIIDEDGRVVGLLGRACAPNEGRPCTPIAFGAPISAIKSFLRTVPATAVAPPAWLGIQGLGEAGPVAKGVRILVVFPESPADEAKLKGGDRSISDTILAVDGTPVTSPEALADAIRAHAVGEKVPLTVFGQGRYRQVSIVLRPAPDARSAHAAPPPAHPAELPPLGEAAPPAGAPRRVAPQRR
jgi:serine protease Do